MTAANTYSTPSAIGLHRMARGTVTNGLRASRATVPALSNPTNDVIASSTANPTAGPTAARRAVVAGCTPRTA